jgi:hypothetical protein
MSELCYAALYYAALCYAVLFCSALCYSVLCCRGHPPRPNDMHAPTPPTLFAGERRFLISTSLSNPPTPPNLAPTTSTTPPLQSPPHQPALSYTVSLSQCSWATWRTSLIYRGHVTASSSPPPPIRLSGCGTFLSGMRSGCSNTAMLSQPQSSTQPTQSVSSQELSMGACIYGVCLRARCVG